MNGVSLCAGVAGLELGLGLVLPAYRTILHVEREAYAAAVLVARMADGWLDPAPVWDDVVTLDGRRWRGLVDCVVAGFPCQPWSAAGKGEGVDDERWIWPDIRDRIREMDPGLVWLENVPPLISRGGLGVVLGDLADLRFDAEWGVFRAADVGASHRRARVFILAYNERGRLALERATHDHDGRDASRHESHGCDAAVANADRLGRQARGSGARRAAWDRADASRARVAVADTDGARLQGLVDRSAAQRRQVALESSRFGRAALAAADVGDASSGGRRELRQSSGRGGFTDRAIPIFPPGPGDVDAWRRILARRPDLAPALDNSARFREYGSDRAHGRRRRRVSEAGVIRLRDMVDTTGGMQRSESEEPPTAERGRTFIETRIAGSDRAVHIARWCELGSVCFDPNQCDPADVCFLARTGRECPDGWRWDDDAGEFITDAEAERAVRGMAHGLTHRVDRLRACGNGVVPLAVAYAFRTLATRAGLLR